MKATFEKSVDVLVKAYLNDTLEHGNCYACAVGNLVVSAMNYHYTKRKFPHGCSGSELTTREAIENDNEAGGYWYSPHPGVMSEAIREVRSTGYTNDDIIEIERAFEGVDGRGDKMFNGLMAVVDILAEIHNVDLSVKEQAIGQFVTVQKEKATA